MVFRGLISCIVVLIGMSAIAQSSSVDQFTSIKGVKPGQQKQGLQLISPSFIPVQWVYPSKYPVVYSAELKALTLPTILSSLEVQHILIEEFGSKVKSVIAVVPYSKEIRGQMLKELGPNNGPSAYITQTPDYEHAYEYTTWKGRNKQVILINYIHTGLQKHSNSLQDQHSLIVLQDLDLEDDYISKQRSKTRISGKVIEKIK